MIKKLIALFVLGAVLVTAADGIASLFKSQVDVIALSEEFASTLDLKTKKATEALYEVQTEIRKNGVQKTQVLLSESFTKLYREEGISLAVFRNDELVLWSSNMISPVSMLRAGSVGTSVKKFDNGWYRLIYLTDGVDEYCASILLKRSFPYENSYLNSNFAFEFEHPSLRDISTTRTEGSVKLKAGNQSFYLVFSDDTSGDGIRALIFALLALIGAFCVVYSLSRLCILAYNQRFNPIYAVLFIVGLIFLRYLSLISSWPSYIEQYDLFSPTIYASSYLFPSLADFLINASLIFLFAYGIRAHFVLRKSIANTALAYSFLTILIAGLFLFGALINHLVKGLVVNSNIPFNIDNILGLNIFSFLAIIGGALLYFSYYLLGSAILNFARSQFINLRSLSLLVVVITLVYVVFTHLIGIRDLYFVLWPPILIILMIVFDYREKQRAARLSGVIFGIAFFAIIASHNFIKYTESREHAERQVLVDKIAVDDDPIAEILYSEVANALGSDQDVREVFFENELHTRATMEDFVLSRYFTGYWSKYDITLYAFLSDSSVWGKLSAVRPKTFSEIQETLSKYGQPSSMNEGLYFMYNTEDLVTYMAVLPLDYSLARNPDGYLVFEFSSHLFPRQLGFPSLLIDEGANYSLDNSLYSTARYVKGKLIRSRGDYPYQAHPGSFKVPVGEREYIINRGYEHLTAKIDEATTIVISKALKSPLDKATTFSYLCALFGILYIFGVVLRKTANRNSPFELNLNQKVQALLVGLTITGLLFFALATRYYIEKKYTEKNTRQISEKMQSVLLELENKLGEEESLNYDMSDLLNRMLSQFSYIFFTDINIYNPEGNLLASSQMRMFNEGLISRRIHPKSYAFLRYLDQVEFIHDEEIGDMSYISGYVPFYNDQGVLLAYVNLPYFAKQSELESEISSFLVSVINIFVVLFLFAILIGLFMAQWITAPLRVIREGLSEMELGKSSKLIAYKGTDEIGLLVSEYNSKVSELENNAEKLAQSERESAWREMAKQVAHEIKNPLTPMKLSVQHLDRAMDSGAEISPEFIKKLTASLIEQIDALSGIANAFSDFARMPQARTTQVDLARVIEQAVDLYAGMESVKIEFENQEGQECMVLGDKDQMIRVFNNLIKNASHAIEDVEQGQILIRLKTEDQGFCVSVADNGLGIDPALKARIFVPNFTTKSKGTGLGLAISKNIVEQAGGKIWFESKLDKGSTFYVWLPSEA